MLLPVSAGSPVWTQLCTIPYAPLGLGMHLWETSGCVYECMQESLGVGAGLHFAHALVCVHCMSSHLSPPLHVHSSILNLYLYGLWVIHVAMLAYLGVEMFLHSTCVCVYMCIHPAVYIVPRMSVCVCVPHVCMDMGMCAVYTHPDTLHKHLLPSSPATAIVPCLWGEDGDGSGSADGRSLKAGQWQWYKEDAH